MGGWLRFKVELNSCMGIVVVFSYKENNDLNVVWLIEVGLSKFVIFRCF